MTWRGISGKMLGHRLSTRERFCYLMCGINDHLSFIVPILLHHKQMFILFENFNRTIGFWE